MKRTIKKLLYRSFDVELPSRQHHLLERARTNSPEVQRESERVRRLRSRLVQVEAKPFKPFFADRVIRRLASQPQPDEFFEALAYMFRRIIFAAIACSVVLFSLSFLLVQKNEFVDYAKSKMTLDELVDPTLSTLEELL